MSDPDLNLTTIHIAANHAWLLWLMVTLALVGAWSLLDHALALVGGLLRRLLR